MAKRDDGTTRTSGGTTTTDASRAPTAIRFMKWTGGPLMIFYWNRFLILNSAIPTRFFKIFFSKILVNFTKAFAFSNHNGRDQAMWLIVVMPILTCPDACKCDC